MSLFQRFTKKLQHDTFTSIQDLPIGRWHAVNTKLDFGFLYLKYQEPKNEVPELEKIWAKIFNEYLEVFGISEEFKEHLSKIKHLSLLKYEQVIEFDSLADAEITILENEINTKGEDTFGLAMAGLTKFMGQPIHPERTSVYEFYNNINLMKQWQQTQSKAMN